MRGILLVVLMVAGFAVRSQQSDTLQQGKASYYASKFNGRRTSSGEVFRNDSLTAAHKTLPFGTKVKVTSIHAGTSVVVRINDRLPKTSKRIIDLSQTAAAQLGMIKKGLDFVIVEVVKD